MCSTKKISCICSTKNEYKNLCAFKVDHATGSGVKIPVVKYGKVARCGTIYMD